MTETQARKITEDGACQLLYETFLRHESSHDEAFCLTALCEARSSFTFDELANIKCDDRPPSREKVSDNFDVQVAYCKMRLQGQSHNMAEMLATRSFPGLKTDAIFMEGRCNGSQFEKTPGQGDYYRRVAEAQGFNTVGKTYLAGLADYPGDPTAWVSDRSDVLRVAREKNLTVRGYVEHKGHEVEPTPDVPLAEDLIQREVNELCDGNPGVNREEVRDEIIQYRTGAVDPNPLILGPGPDLSEGMGDD